MKFVLFLGSTRDGRNCDRVMKAVMARFHVAAPHIVVEVVDPLKYDLPLLRQALHKYQDSAQAPAMLLDIDAKIREADGYVLITPKYNRSIPPALSNMLDHFDPRSFNYNASGIVSYSIELSGGCIAAVDLRKIMCEFGASPVAETPTISEVAKAIDETGRFVNDIYVAKIDRMIAQLVWTATAMRRMKESNGFPE